MSHPGRHQMSPGSYRTGIASSRLPGSSCEASRRARLSIILTSHDGTGRQSYVTCTDTEHSCSGIQIGQASGSQGAPQGAQRHRQTQHMIEGKVDPIERIVFLGQSSPCVLALLVPCRTATAVWSRLHYTANDVNRTQNVSETVGTNKRQRIATTELLALQNTRQTPASPARAP